MEGMSSRRDFLKFTLGTAALLGTKGLFATEELLRKRGIKKLTVLYTNDQHSRIEAFPANDPKYAGEGGFSVRASLIEKIRGEEENVLLLDAGDIFQGTPYFNYYQGELEYKLMSIMKYDAVTLGNHDFDLGCENILKQMPHAKFDFINANYDFSQTVLSSSKRIAPYRIYKKGGVKIGVTGVGIDLNNLVSKDLIKGIRCNDPVSIAEKWASVLKNDEKCDLVICLSHLGFKYEDKKISDIGLASLSKNIDLIIGGHTHTFLEEPHPVKNSNGIFVPVTQVGWAGIWLGRIDYYFSECGKYNSQNCSIHRVL
jgi:5'-nucleotidase